MESTDPFNWPDDFDSVAEELKRCVLSVCARRGVQSADADDVVQHVLCKVAIAAADTTGGPHGDRDLSRRIYVLRYGIRIATNYITEIRRIETRRKASPATDPDTLPSKEKSSEQFTELLDLIDHPLERKAVRLKIVEDCSYQEIAEQMKVSKSQARNLVQRGGKQALRRLR